VVGNFNGTLKVSSGLKLPSSTTSQENALHCGKLMFLVEFWLKFGGDFHFKNCLVREIYFFQGNPGGQKYDNLARFL